MIRFGTARLMPLVTALSMAFAIAVSGCGRTGATQVDELTSDTTTTTDQYDTSTDSGLYTDTSTTSTTPATASETSTPATASETSTPATASVEPTPATASVTPTPAPTAPPIDLAYALRVYDVKTQLSGILSFKKVTATVSVMNPSFLMQRSGTLVVTFTKKGAIVETQRFSVVLDPAEIRDYTLKSEKYADAATADVLTVQ